MMDKRQIVKDRLRKLESMRQDELEAKFLELFGFAPADTTTQKLRARLAYRIQEIFLGGLEAADAAALERAAAEDPLSNFQVPKGKGGIPKQPGTQLRRVWKGEEHVVTIVGDGVFEYKGERYTSLGRVAKVITGGHWNAKVFFGLR